LLGKLMLFDKELSVNRNEACVFCHMPETGFTGSISEINRTTGSYPGSVRTRFSESQIAVAPLSLIAVQSRNLMVAHPGSGPALQFPSAVDVMKEP
jgi:cytochrome c peroxidase